MANGAKWTPAEDAVLRAMVGNEAFAHQIAAATGRSLDAVRGRARVLDLDMYGPGKKAKMSASRSELGRRNIAFAKLAIEAKRPQFEERRRAAIYRARCIKLYPDMPEHLWPAVSALRTKHGLLSRDAYEMVMADWRRDVLAALRSICAVAADHARAEIAKRGTFEALVERVRNGARLVPAFKQGRALSEHRSLIGGSMTDLAA